MNIRLLFVIIFSYINSSFSQNSEFDFYRGDSDNVSVLGNNENYFFVRKNKYILKKDYKNSLLETFLFENNIPSKEIQLVIQNDIPVIVSRGGGMVWKVTNDTFRRVDNSFDHKMTNQSTVFVRNDTIMKFGGYGYWSSRNFFTYYSEKSNEWEFYSINQLSALPPGVSDVSSTYSNNNFYFSGGLKSDPKFPLSKTINDNVWRFDFTNRTWVDLGTAKFNSNTRGQSLEIGDGRMLFDTNDPLVVLVQDDLKINSKFTDFGKENYNQFGAFIYDYQKNELSTVEQIGPYLEITKAFVANDSIYNYRKNKLIGISLNSLLTKAVRQGAMYVDTKILFDNLTRFTGVALILLFIALLFIYSKNRKRPRLSESGFRFNRVHYPLSENELLILNLIIYNKRVESKTILKKIYDTDLSIAQNNRIKNEAVESLNKKVSNIMGVKNFINSKKSLKDQRMLIYYSNFRKDFVI